MACCRPFTMPQPRYYSKYSSWRDYPFGVQIPCGYCLNCRVDNRNMWEDRAKYEFKRRLTASFVTLTYSDEEIAQFCQRNPITGEVQCSLHYDHIRLFIHRLREYIKYHPELHSVLCQPNFSYIYVGEYGENGSQFDRPHFHVLFFGLDFAFMRKVFMKEWKYGFIDVLPLLDGGIRYVLKYMDKTALGVQAKEKYDNNFLARPRRYSSLSFGSDFFMNREQIKDMRENNWTYQSGKVRRPCPAYYKKRILGDTSIRNHPTLFKARLSSIAKTRDEMRTIHHLHDYSMKAVKAFQLRKAEYRERKLRQMLLNDGVGVFDFTSKSDIYYAPNRELVLKMPVTYQRWLSESYRNSIDLGGILNE